MDTSNLSGMALRLGIGVVSIVIVLFMLDRRDFYPLWTVVMMGLVGLAGFVSLARNVREH